MSKRIFDILLSIALLPILLPLIVIFSLVLIVELHNFPFLIQERGITLDKFRFKIIKLRTIRGNNKNKKHSSKSVFFKPQFIDDVPKFSGWLRRTGLDEIPQIFNIIKGEMSFVGPRPFMLSDLKLLKTNDWEYYKIRRNFNSKPGVTGLWQIFCYREEGAKNLIALEKIYDEMKSVKYDIKILLYTLPVVITANNADSIFCSKTFPFKNNLNSSSTTELDIIFEEYRLNQTLVSSEYKLRIPGDWWTEDRSLEFGEHNKNQLKLLKIKPTSKKTA